MDAPGTPTKIVGHRGASALVKHENTLEAFQRTADVGAGWVELDVRRLRDGTLVVHHDPAFNGTLLSTLSLDALRSLSAEEGFAVPTLEEALAFCTGRVGVDIEIKEQGVSAQVADIAQRTMQPDQYVYTSFHDRVIGELKVHDPKARAGLLIGHPNPEPVWLTRLTEVYPTRRLRSCGADFAAVNIFFVRLGILKRLRAARFPAWVWTVNDEMQIRHLLEADVEAIITDHPDLGVALRAEMTHQHEHASNPASLQANAVTAG